MKPTRHDRALVLRVSPYGEADAVVQLFTAREGVTPALARRARSATPRRQAMVLEPFHTLAVELQRGSGELAVLKASSLSSARTALLESPGKLDAAGLITRWTRALSPAHVPEPEVFDALEKALDAIAEGVEVDAVLTIFGLTLLDALGYGLELSACARCGRERPAGRAAYVGGAQGGVLCESCRRGMTLDTPLVAGALLDRIEGHDLVGVPVDEIAPLARVVASAIQSRAQALGARLS